jgi:hypothetical protein
MTELREPNAFRYELKKVGERLLIEGRCLRCGATKIVSTFDNSLDWWEEQHNCAKHGERRGATKASASPL